MKEFAYIHEEGNAPESIKSIPFLDTFNEEQLNDVLHASNMIECEPGDKIIKEGNTGSRIYLLLVGRVEVVKDGKVVATMKHVGDIFGELAAVEEETRSADVVAAEKSVCLAVDQKFIKDMKPREEDPAFYAAFYEFLAKITAERLKYTSRALAQAEAELAAR